MSRPEMWNSRTGRVRLVGCWTDAYRVMLIRTSRYLWWLDPFRGRREPIWARGHFGRDPGSINADLERRGRFKGSSVDLGGIGQSTSPRMNWAYPASGGGILQSFDRLF